MVSHGGQLKDIKFTGNITVTKDSGVSSIEMYKDSL